ncbi:GGDEF domain-containing protein [soil metagenome]
MQSLGIATEDIPPLRSSQIDVLFLSREPKRRIRLLQTTIAIGVTLSGVAAMQLVAWAGFASWNAVVPWTVASVAGYAGFFAAIRFGWSERCADPALTAAQMIYAVSCCAVGYAVAGPMRGAVFPLAMVVLMFGMFQLPPRHVLFVCIYSVLAFGAVMVSMTFLQPAVFPLPIELSHFALIATMMPTVSLLASQLSRMRARLQTQKAELRKALAHIEFLATRDELTGLINRRHITDLLEREERRSTRNGTSFCIALVDIDHFKRVNDTYGHGAGDDSLRAFAKTGTALTRASDALARWGGEEFLLLITDSALLPACDAIERLRKAIAQLSIHSGDSVIRMTISAGVVQHDADASLRQTIERADASLYRAKSCGRNRVVEG